MNRSSGFQLDRQAIYNIYKACRLCSTGDGYKMPIIQNVISVALNDVPLSQKIQECVDLEISLEDRMPPLICEQCIDRVNDFYDFRDMCQRTNKETRAKLGLPLKITKKDTPQTDKSTIKTAISDDDRPLGSNKNNQRKVKLKKEDLKVEMENKTTTETALKTRKEPQRNDGRNVKTEEQSITTKAGPKCMKLKRELKTSLETQEKSKKSQNAVPHCSKKLSKEVLLLKADLASLNYGKSDDTWYTSTRKCLKGLQKELMDIKAEGESFSGRNLKRVRDKAAKTDLPAKKNRQCSEPGRQRRPSTPERDIYTQLCPCCDQKFKNYIGLSNHMRTHPPTYTSDMFACNACRLWFISFEETRRHHKQHSRKKPYVCQGCNNRFVTYILYNEHIDKMLCQNIKEVPDVICRNCKEKFPTINLRKNHKCTGQIWKCQKCKRSVSSKNNLRRHQNICMKRNVATKPVVDPEIKARLLKMQVRIAKCDPLLDEKGYCDARQVPYTYGLDTKFVYPYIYCIPHIKIESQFALNDSDAMVDINNDFMDIPVDDPDEYVHWDSDDSCDGETSPVKTPAKLSTLSIKAIYSPKFLGKVAKRQRKIKSEIDSSMTGDIDSLIGNLDSDIKKDDSLDDWFQKRGDTEFSAFDSLKDADNSNDSFSLLNSCDNGAVVNDNANLDVETSDVRIDSSFSKQVVRSRGNDSEVDTCSENEDDVSKSFRIEGKNVGKTEDLRTKDLVESDKNVESDVKEATGRDDDDPTNTDSQETTIEEKDTDRNKDLKNASESDLKEVKSEAKDLNSDHEPDLVDECEEIISNIININSLISKKETTNDSENLNENDDDKIEETNRTELNNEIIGQKNSINSVSEEINATDDDLSRPTHDHEVTLVDNSKNKDIDITNEPSEKPVEIDSSKDNQNLQNHSIEPLTERTDDSEVANEKSEIDDSSVENVRNQSNHNFECKKVSRLRLGNEKEENFVNGKDYSKSKEERVMDDKELMDELDAQIAGYGGETGETNVKSDDKNSTNDKISLNDLINVKSDDLTSLKLDNISEDDFDFDV